MGYSYEYHDGLGVDAEAGRKELWTMATQVAGVPVTVNESSFAQLVTGSKPILLDVWAEWCAPCRRLAPELQQVAAELADELVVAKLNVDENLELAQSLGVQGIPALFLIKDGQLLDAWTGFMPADDVIARVRPHLS